MAKSKTEKKKAKRKAKQKQNKIERSKTTATDRGRLYYEQAMYFAENSHLEKAITCIKKAFKLVPDDFEILVGMGHIGSIIGEKKMELEAMKGLKRIGRLKPDMWISLLEFTVKDEQYEESIALADELLSILPGLPIQKKRDYKRRVLDIREYCEGRCLLQNYNREVELQKQKKSISKKTTEYHPPAADQKNISIQKPVDKKKEAHQPDKEKQQIPFEFQLQMDSFYEPFLEPSSIGIEKYELSIASHTIRFQESFENLICLAGLTGIRSLWYQEETARKVLKRFRGRALLSDEVGLGKTIEALIVFSEYIKRGMVKTGLILTPAPLVSQWKDELLSKFGLDIPSTDDIDFKSKSDTFWEEPFVLVSINQAKSKKNYDIVTGKSYDIVIVDEAHHLKNRDTLNWKLVNALKKRFILLLTATPVENNLMELYNLITLLKPGQLETASSFREKFMTKGDPTDPQNRSFLKELLGEVMIRNTRALAGIKIPPRFAETLRIPASKTEKVLYERLQILVSELNNLEKGNKLVIKNLLAQAGSSPTALEKTISKMLMNKEYQLKHEN
ncbi:MAG: ATP-dependent helicase, partial [Deltaproteobacteria bacterium]